MIIPNLAHSHSNFRLLQLQTETILKQLKGVCKIISGEDYNKKMPQFYNATVGGHTRHILDHMNQVLIVSPKPINDNSSGVIKHGNRILHYDIRSRNTDIETAKETAHTHCETLLFQLSELLSVTERLGHDIVHETNNKKADDVNNNNNSNKYENKNDEVYTLHTNVEVEFMANSAGDSYRLPSTVGRELCFVTHHGVHHLSTIKLMMDAMKYTSSDTAIGIASSTLHSNQSLK